MGFKVFERDRRREKEKENMRRFRLYGKGKHVELSSNSDCLRDRGGNSIIDNIVNILVNGAMIPLKNEKKQKEEGRA